MRLLLAVIAIGLFAMSSLAGDSQDPNDVRAVRAVISRGIKLLEAQAYPKFLTEIWPPDKVRDATASRSLENLSDRLAKSGDFAMLLEALKACEGVQPVTAKDGQLLVFVFKKPVRQLKNIGFITIRGRWYMFQ